MKKIFIIALLVSCYTVSFAQAKFSASVTNTGNNLIFQLKPDANITTGFSTIEFFLRYPSSSPAFSYGLVTVNTAAFPGMAGNGTTGGGAANSGAWEIIRNDPNLAPIAGSNVDHFIYTAPAVATTAAAYTGGTAYDVITINLVGTPPNTVDFQFISDDTYGTGYLAITDQNGGDLLPASFNSYFFPTTSSTTLGGATIYYQDLTNVPVPVKFLDFSVIKKDADAQLKWSVENESSITDRYEVLRSANGRDFVKVETIAPKNNGLSSNTYELTQTNVTSVYSASGILYYRIRQVDKDGKEALTEIRNLRLLKGFGVAAYPNLVKSSTKLTIDLVEAAEISINVINAAGQQIKAFQLQGVKGTNFRDVDMSNLASGNYMIKVQAGKGELKSIQVTKIN